MVELQLSSRLAALGNGITLTHIFRFALLVLLPFLLGLWMLPHTIYTNGQMLGAPNESQSGAPSTLSYSFIHSSSEIDVPQRVNAIFPLADYLDFPPFVSHSNPFMCFQDSGSYVILQNGTRINPVFDWNVYFGTNVVLVVPKNSTKCAAIVPGQNSTYKWVAKLKVDLSDQNLSENLTFVPKTTTYPQFVMDYGLLQGLVLIPVCYLFIWYPAAGIWKKVHNGLDEQ